MEIRLSEWRIRYTIFDTIEEAINHCQRNELTNGRHSILWFNGETKAELDDFMNKHKDIIDHRYMRFAIPETIIWDSMDNKWEDYIDAFEGY